MANKGSPGVDGLTVGKLGGWIKRHKQTFIASLRDGSYQPQPVRGVQIPKPGGSGMRQLGIPTVVDRLVQQAMLQVLERILDPTFSPSSYGFRPGRSAHDALAQARQYVADGRTIVVDIDLEKFFDQVNHDILMSRLGRWVGDKRMLRIIGHFLRAGLMQNGAGSASPGVCLTREEGTPQGGPLRHCWPTCCWTIWTRNWRNAGISSAATPTTAIPGDPRPPLQLGDGAARDPHPSLRRQGGGSALLRIAFRHCPSHLPPSWPLSSLHAQLAR